MREFTTIGGERLRIDENEYYCTPKSIEVIDDDGCVTGVFNQSLGYPVSPRGVGIKEYVLTEVRAAGVCTTTFLYVSKCDFHIPCHEKVGTWNKSPHGNPNNGLPHFESCVWFARRVRPPKR
jgi:hypothetical protein